MIIFYGMNLRDSDSYRYCVNAFSSKYVMSLIG